MARLEKAQAEWRRFEEEDKPAFARWMAATFGALLSRIRETAAQIQEKESWIAEVEMEMLLGHARTYRAAYERVHQRRTNPAFEFNSAAADTPPPVDDSFEKQIDEELDEMEQVFLFEEYAWDVLNIDPDRLSDRKYRQLFEEFKANVLNAAKPQSAPQPEPPQPAPEPKKPTSSRIKEAYRELVRRLHPDRQKKNGAETHSLWHDVQEAYAQQNLGRLEMLLALTDLHASTIGEHTSFTQMRAVLDELRRSYQALQRNLHTAKQDPAWKFSQHEDHSKVQQRLQEDLEHSLYWQEEKLGELEDFMASWTQPPRTRKSAKKKAQPAKSGRNGRA